MVPLRDGGQEPALTWAHYKRVADVPDEDGRDFRTVADRVVGELWDFFRVEPEWRDRAVSRAYDACPKLITDMHYEARVQAVRTYYAKKLGRKIEKKAARTIWLAAEQYMQGPEDPSTGDFSVGGDVSSGIQFFIWHGSNVS
ncbi:hypothetical protein EJB05_39785 [Eragrostis curvula]|uniref:Uncharacterized protein n=1 Tax=Eragrostis curvula TaxID=38414 RepID=A0A5J9TXW9_9POAL|nr:hypothetical protein EJB05_39785 [Eragrostis curvula]